VVFQGRTETVSAVPNWSVAWLRNKIGVKFQIASAMRKDIIMRPEGTLINVALTPRKFIKTVLSNNTTIHISFPIAGAGGVKKDVALKKKDASKKSSSSSSQNPVADLSYEELLLTQRIANLDRAIPSNCTVQEIVNACAAIKHLSSCPPKFFEVMVSTMNEATINNILEEFDVSGNSTEIRIENILPHLLPEVAIPLQKMLDTTHMVKKTLSLSLFNVYKKEFMRGSRPTNHAFLKLLNDRKDNLAPKPEITVAPRTQEDMAVDAVIQGLGSLRITNTSL
jgi:hypothetical protein